MSLISNDNYSPIVPIKPPVRKLNATRFPKGEIPAQQVLIDVAVGEYQFHNILSQHGITQSLLDGYKISGMINMEAEPITQLGLAYFDLTVQNLELDDDEFEILFGHNPYDHLDDLD